MNKVLEKVQLQLMQSEKMASLGKLAAGEAHQLNNPLGGVTLYTRLVLEDYELPGKDGMEVLAHIRQQHPTILSIIITGYATVDAAIAAMKRGAYDFIFIALVGDEQGGVHSGTPPPMTRARGLTGMTFSASGLSVAARAVAIATSCLALAVACIGVWLYTQESWLQRGNFGGQEAKFLDTLNGHGHNRTPGYFFDVVLSGRCSSLHPSGR
jgi:CheY-like chemotaxis protein